MVKKARQFHTEQPDKHFLTPSTKINSKCIKDLYERSKNHETHGTEHRQTTLLTNCTNTFWMSPKAKKIKAKIKKWDLIKLKSFAQQRKPFKT